MYTASTTDNIGYPLGLRPAGQKVATLVRGLKAAGTYALRWDGQDDDGSDLASGIYLYRLQVGDQVETRKLILLR
ncbi:MAG: T9SS type A sorting domain-containing protein [Candidatus Latescibacteria bacterium]|nr:T9SS type A sorting domain-containing protein [Candidatus Latescibacterota bacterium]